MGDLESILVLFSTQPLTRDLGKVLHLMRFCCVIGNMKQTKEKMIWILTSTFKKAYCFLSLDEDLNFI